MPHIKAKLYVGNHNYCRWSLRPWLALRWAGFEFEEVLISLAQPGYAGEAIQQVAADPDFREWESRPLTDRISVTDEVYPEP